MKISDQIRLRIEICHRHGRVRAWVTPSTMRRLASQHQVSRARQYVRLYCNCKHKAF